MKRLFAVIIGVLTAFAISVPLLAAPVYAAPSADPLIRVISAEREGEDVVVTVGIAIGAPSEPYASLDFNLVSSDPAQLSIIDLNDDAEVTTLDITFAPGYGNAYHSGRDYEATGGYGYLMSIYAQSAGNQIAGATDICSVRLRYHGEETQTLQVRDMKLVYVDEAGGIVATYIPSDSDILAIDASLATEIGDQAIPLGAPSGGPPPALWIVLAAVVVIAIAMLLRRKWHLTEK
jgi:hypothetical protein